MVMGKRDMLYYIVIALTSTREATVQATMGHQAHAAFLHTVEDAGTALAHPVSKRRRSQSRSR